jgi:hypothetical protein
VRFHRQRPPQQRRRSVFAAQAVTLTDHEAYALAFLMTAVGRLEVEAIDWLAGHLLTVAEERQALPSACRRIAQWLAANGWDVGTGA